MKTRESGMPEESLWAGFFDPPTVLAKLGLTAGIGDVVDFGCGYGTFTIPAARIIRGVVHALDIDPAMVEATAQKARAAGLPNVRARCCDFTERTGLPEASIDYVMLFNILHAQQPLALLREAFRILRPAGLLGIMYWNYDPTTPRGPSMDIRPTSDQCQIWARQAGFQSLTSDPIDLPPYHYGWLMRKPAA